MATFNDPILYGRCDASDISGTVMTDKGSGVHTITLSGSTTPSTGTGHIKEGIVLDGSTQFINCGAASDLDLTTALTLALWVKINGSASQQLMAKDSNVGGRAYTLDIAGLNPRFYINGGGNTSTNEVDAPSGIGTGVWTHIAATYVTGTKGTMTLYVNASQVAQITTADTSIPLATSNLTVGKREYSGFNQFLAGTVDEFRVYSRALSAVDIAALYAFTGASKLLEARRKAAA